LLDITSDKQREFLFDMQMKDVESIARELMSNAGTIREEFTTAKHLEHVRPMFQVNQKRINIKKNFFFVFRKLGHHV
jgi:hypothetical protein